jgi:hypothetical protein
MKGAPYEVMVAFAPGQLGDKGYADNVLSGVNTLSRFIDSMTDTLERRFNVRFISPYSMDELHESITAWARNAANPFVDDTYKRRLLVLTEPYMVAFLDSIKEVLPPTDEVLVMKVNEDDVKQAAQKSGLGNRLHGLNISAAPSIRRFCRYMKREVGYAKENGRQLNYLSLPVHRLYDETFLTYRDSVIETLTEELEKDVNITPFVYSSEKHAGIISSDGNFTVYQVAYLWADAWQMIYKDYGCGYAIIDLGSGNAGWDYWILGRSTTGEETFQTLVLDSEESPLLNRFYICRHFNTALVDWVPTWIEEPACTMPAFKNYSKEQIKDSRFIEYCTDNIPI